MSTQVMEEPLVASGGLFRNLHRLPVLTDEQEKELVERVRDGDDQARHALILGVLRQMVHRIRRRVGKGEVLWRVEWEDVMQHLYLVLWEQMAQVLSKPNVGAVLYLMASHAFFKYVKRFQSLVMVPVDGIPVPVVESLDVPVEREREEMTALECLEAPAVVLGSGAEPDYQQLYQAIRSLSAGERQAVIERYGLEHVCGSPEVRGSHCSRALKRLRQALQEAYPQYAGEYRRVQVRPVCADRVLREDQLHRLRQARQELCTKGEQVTWKALARQARIDTHVARAYWYHYQQEQVA